MFKCQYCGKILKTEKGYNNHKCEKKLRFENFNYMAYTFFILFFQLSRIKLPLAEDDKKIRFITSPYYKSFIEFANWAEEIQLLNNFEYMKFLVDNNVEQKKWTSEQVYKSFLFEYLRKESLEDATKRAESYLNEFNISLDNISPYRLYLALCYGKINVKYLKSKNFDYMSKLECNESEKGRLQFFLEI